MTTGIKTAARGIRNDPFVKGILKRLPAAQRDSFDDEQLQALKVALGARAWGTHTIDFCWTMRFWRKSYYFVFISGANRRPPSRRQQELERFGKAVLLTTVFLASAVIGFLILYIVKSALGIDFIDNFSLGIWSAIKDAFNGGLF